MKNETYSSGVKIEVGETYSGCKVLAINSGFDQFSPDIIVYQRSPRTDKQYCTAFYFARLFVK